MPEPQQQLIMQTMQEAQMKRDTLTMGDTQTMLQQQEQQVTLNMLQMLELLFDQKALKEQEVH